MQCAIFNGILACMLSAYRPLKNTLRALCALLFSLPCGTLCLATPGPLILGVSQTSLYQETLAHSRVALVVNQASLSPEGHTIDVLLKQGVNVVKLFALEHGVRGDHGAGAPVENETDEKTGLPIVSLYGDTKKPTPQMLQDIDVIVFDIQDVGVRFYTYISSLGLIMEAVAQSEKMLLVFDRPNPNGDYVAGPILKPNLKSFVGMYPIPVVYGLTIGEFSLMASKEKWVASKNLKLQVIPLKNYDRREIYPPLAPPSPGLRDIQAIRAYPSLALLEPTIISIGRGTEHPYSQYGFPDKNFGSHTFIPQPGPLSDDPIYSNQTCYGEEVYSLAAIDVPKFTTDIFQKAQLKLPAKSIISDLHFFKLLVGDEKTASQLLLGSSYSDLTKIFQKEMEEYLKKRAKYLLY